MMSVMSDRAPKSLKTEYAFRVYDFDGDDMIGAEDISRIVDHLLLGNDAEAVQGATFSKDVTRSKYLTKFAAATSACDFIFLETKSRLVGEILICIWQIFCHRNVLSRNKQLLFAL